jgi:enoyl-[acyl-carrier protein] reductase II
MNLHTPICDLLDIEYPIFLAGMGGVAYADVCAAVSIAGGYGTLGMAGCSPERIREEMQEVRRQTDKPFGVDLLAALPESIEAAIDIIIDEGANSFISGLGVPGPIVSRCHEAGLQVVSMCGKVEHALAAEAAGVDIVVAQGTEAGGHTGRIAGLALIPQIVDAVDIPVIAAGSIVDGRGYVAALSLGAQGIWMGTRFIASTEARAAENYKQRLVEGKAASTVITRCYSGKPMRVLDNAWVKDWESRSDEIEPFPKQSMLSYQAGAMNLTFDDYEEFEVEKNCAPAGQGVGSIDEIMPAGEIVRSIVAEARETIGNLHSLL